MSTQPEQLVEAQRRVYGELEALQELVETDALDKDELRAAAWVLIERIQGLRTDLANVERARGGFATALSECRERERAIIEYLANCDRYGGFPSTATLRKMLAAQPPSEAMPHNPLGGINFVDAFTPPSEVSESEKPQPILGPNPMRPFPGDKASERSGTRPLYRNDGAPGRRHYV